MWPEVVGDALNMPESITVDAPFRKRGDIRRKLQAAGVDVKFIGPGNKGSMPWQTWMTCVVLVERYHGAAARNTLVRNGYKLI